jgi:hypothetical protein
MSGVNGDKSRFNRERKQKIARREHTREIMKRLAEPPKPVTASSAAQKPKPVSA